MIFLLNEIKIPLWGKELESIHLIFLWSDFCLLLLLLLGILSFFKIRKNEFWKKGIEQIIKNRMAMISLLILSLYFIIATLDSIHFQIHTKQGSGEIESSLDLILHKVKYNNEKTYSSPLAIFSSLKENININEGKGITRTYSRLKYGGKHLTSAENRYPDLLAKLFSGIVWFIIWMSLFLALLSLYMFRKRQIYHWKEIITRLSNELSWLFIPTTLFIFLFSMIFPFYGEYHIFGTDKAGFDVFYISLKSIRTGILIGTLTTLVVTPIAILAGIFSGYLSGWVDDLIQYIYTTLESIPDILLIAAAMLIAETFIVSESSLEHADRKFLYLCFIMGITSWTNLCRLIRAETLKVRELEFVEAAKSFGINKFKIMLNHILPNVIHIVFIVVVLRFSSLVLAEAVLSYVGIGVDPTIHSWGNMINQARFELAREPLIWWNLVSAFLFMFILVLPANILADSVRDALDPKLKR